MGKRHAIPGALSGVQMGLIITPMLDMSFQILSFFVMTYHPSALEGHIDGKLLPPEKVQVQGKENPNIEPFPALDEPPEMEDAAMVVIKAMRDGKKGIGAAEGSPRLLEISLKRGPTRENIPVAMSDIALDKPPPEADYERLTKQLKELLGDRTQSAGDIKVQPDAEIRHRYVMRVYDACKQAGFQKVGLVGPDRPTKAKDQDAAP